MKVYAVDYPDNIGKSICDYGFIFSTPELAEKHRSACIEKELLVIKEVEVDRNVPVDFGGLFAYMFGYRKDGEPDVFGPIDDPKIYFPPRFHREEKDGQVAIVYRSYVFAKDWKSAKIVAAEQVADILAAGKWPTEEEEKDILEGHSHYINGYSRFRFREKT